MSYTPEPTLIPSKTAARAMRDLEFIVKQLLRFARLQPKELFSHLRKCPQDNFCTIRRPDGRGNYHCGSLAWRKFGSLADIAIELEPALGGRIGRERTKKTVIESFVRLVLQEEREVDLDTATELLRGVVATLRDSLIVCEHYVPCILFLNGGPAEFNLGPVTFSRRTKFFKDKRETFKRSAVQNTAAHVDFVNSSVAQGFPRERAMTEADSAKLVRNLQARAIKSFRAYPWIASVTITNCDKETSREHAEKVVEIALHTMRVILGAQHTKKLRRAWSYGESLRTAHMWSDVRNVIHVSTGATTIGPVGPTNWHDILTGSSIVFDVLGAALAPLTHSAKTSLLHNRLIDAIKWFGDAATDSAVTPSIVKYVSAIERLFFGRFHHGHKNVFAARVKVILDAFDCGKAEKIYAMALDVYDTRSKLLHGALSPEEPKVQHVIEQAEQLSRMCLLCTAQLYPMILRLFGNPDPSKLEEIMTRITDQGITWLLTESPAGDSSSSLTQAEDYE